MSIKDICFYCNHLRALHTKGGDWGRSKLKCQTAKCNCRSFKKEAGR